MDTVVYVMKFETDLNKSFTFRVRKGSVGIADAAAIAAYDKIFQTNAFLPSHGNPAMKEGISRLQTYEQTLDLDSEEDE